jgi:hypothetical protein
MVYVLIPLRAATGGIRLAGANRLGEGFEVGVHDERDILRFEMVFEKLSRTLFCHFGTYRFVQSTKVFVPV